MSQPCGLPVKDAFSDGDDSLLVALGLSLGIHILVLATLPLLYQPAPTGDRPMLITVLSLPEAFQEKDRASVHQSRQVPKEVDTGPRTIPTLRDPEVAATPSQIVPVPSAALTELATSPANQPTMVAPQRSRDLPLPSLTDARQQLEVPAPVTNQMNQPGRSPGVGSGAGGELDQGSLEQYRLSLISAARRYRRYPPQAMERGWQGRVEIRLEISAEGQVRSAIVRTGSGYPILDQQALEMITRGKMLTLIPPGLRGREFTVDVPVIFDLRAG